MELKKSPIIAILALLIGTASVSAEKNALVFPPAGNIPNLTYPPQNPTSPRIGSPYTFGQPKTQMPMAPRPPVSMNGFAPNQNRAYGGYVPQRAPVAPYPMPNNRYQYPTNQRNRNSGFPFAGNNMMPYGNNTNNTPFSRNSFGMPTNPMNNMFGGNNNSMPFFGNNNNSSLPFFGNTRKSNRKKAWGTERNIWPDFYTDFTDEAWDTVTSGPRDLGTMPGGWRFPHISTPDPVTVSDAITNQFPPMLEEGGNMMDFSDWGIFD